MLYTLKLDASWRPIQVVDSFKSTGMVLSGRAKVVETYDEEIYPGIKIPKVIVLKNYIRNFPFSKSCNRKNVVWRDKNTCQYCKSKFHYSDLTMDHVVPKSKGGTKTWSNIVASCKPCNSKKKNRTPKEANMQLDKKPTKPKVLFFDLINPQIIQEEWKKYK